jgi:Protein of unknown function DUF262/Protein of unknown function (DUF1524)
MQANPRCIDDLFNSQLRYVVPMFQRLYVWSDLQWTTLWEDVTEKAELQLSETPTTAHYLGALIVEGVRPTSPREVKRFLVIDGQQRLTTLQLLLCAFRDIARAAQWTTLDRKTTRLIENADHDVMENPDEEILKLWPTTLNRDVFRTIIRAGSREAVEAEYPLIKLRRRRRPEPRSRLVEAYVFFSGAIQAWLPEAAERTSMGVEDCAFHLLHAIQRDFAVVEIALSEGDDSQEIFYSLNSQGAQLSQSDLLRSLIFMRAEKEKLNRDEIFSEYWSRFESDFWSTEIKRGGRTYSRLDLGLRFFLMAKTGRLIDARRVNEEYRAWVTADPRRYASIKEELGDFTDYAEGYRWYEVLPGETLPSTDLRRVISDFDVSTAVPLLLYLERDAALDEAALAACLAAVESFIARRAFTGEETKEYNKFFVEVIGTLHNIPADERVSMLVAKLGAGLGTTRTWPTDEQVIEAAINRPVGNQMRLSALRLVLERLELGVRTKKSENGAIAPALQVEHVMPRSWGANWLLEGKTIPSNVVAWPWLAEGDFVALADAIRRRNSLIETLGNLTLLNGYANPAASNSAFDVKRQEYKHSVLRLNRYFDSLAVWDEDTVRERGKFLGQALCRIWPRPLD